MEESLTDSQVQDTASQVEPTENPVVETTAETVEQTTPEEVTETTEEVTEDKDTDSQLPPTVVPSEKEDEIAKFAKAQGFDPENLTDTERKALKIARDNQKALRSSKLSKSSASVDGDITRDELESFRQEFRQYQATKKAEEFFREEGRNDALAPVMSEILEEKKAVHGPEYARVLSQDLNLLYDLAQLRSGAVGVDPDQIRQEERESINKQMSGQSGNAHATQPTMGSKKQVVTSEWLRSEYQPGNPEHDALVSEYMNG